MGSASQSSDREIRFLHLHMKSSMVNSTDHLVIFLTGRRQGPAIAASAQQTNLIKKFNERK